jgi:hypothetical protein
MRLCDTGTSSDQLPPVRWAKSTSLDSQTRHMRSYKRSRRLGVGKIAKVYVQGRSSKASACHKTASIPPAHHSGAHCFTCAITPLLLLSRACAVLSTLRGLIPRGLASTPLITTCMAVLSTFVACPRPCTCMPHMKMFVSVYGMTLWHGVPPVGMAHAPHAPLLPAAPFRPSSPPCRRHTTSSPRPVFLSWRDGHSTPRRPPF